MWVMCRQGFGASGEEEDIKTNNDVRDSWIMRNTNCVESQYELG